MIETYIKKYSEYLGSDVKSIENVLISENIIYRIIKPNHLYTCDFVFERINVHCDENDKILKFSIG